MNIPINVIDAQKIRDELTPCQRSTFFQLLGRLEHNRKVEEISISFIKKNNITFFYLDLYDGPNINFKVEENGDIIMKPNDVVRIFENESDS